MDHRFAWILLGCLSWATLCSGTTPEATVGRDQTSNRSPAEGGIYSRRLEERAGLRIALRIEQPGSVLQDPKVSAYVNRVAQRILARSNSDQQVKVKVLMYPAFNAFSIPGGRTYLTVGLLQRLASEDEMAAVLAHEIAHATAHDWANQRTQLILLRARQRTAWRGIRSGGLAGVGRERANARVLAAWRRRAEEDADVRGLDYLYRAGYDPSALVSLLKKASAIEEQSPQWPHVNALNYRETAVRLARVEHRVSSLPARKTHHWKRSKKFVAMQRHLAVIMKR
jgi:predicted Zn-dependent protease